MKYYRHILLFCSVTLLLVANVYAQGDTSGSTNIDSLITKRMAESGILGLGAAIIIDKKVAWEKGYGFSDWETGTAFTTSTLMNIASVSKTVTGACLMKAVEQGKLSLDEDINRYLPFQIRNPYFPDAKVTLRNLATHTSGLTDRYPFYTDSLYFNGKDSPQELGDFLQQYFMPGGQYYSKENFLNHKPGTFREYSNIGAALAGYIVEIRTGQKLNEYSKKYLFNPLKMNDTGWFLSEIDLKKHTKLYEKKDHKIQEIPLYGCTTYPDGGVRSSVADLSHFFICLLNDGKYKNRQVLKVETVREMLRFQFDETYTPENVKPKTLNSGIFWATKMGAKRIGHNGSDPGVRVFMLSDLNKKVAVILFSNTSLSEQEENKFFEVYEDLYRYGLEIKK
ncbi:serine hydrolase domain-containing protein [Pedobacter sp. BG31]|uniref:serine hydrolase domain-containing protein n=1 Tax=Pedobacter sp. BG31 TaxID=3349697 RepID=UPI0035F40DFA